MWLPRGWTTTTNTIRKVFFSRWQSVSIMFGCWLSSIYPPTRFDACTQSTRRFSTLLWMWSPTSLLCSRPTVLQVTFYYAFNRSGPNVMRTKLRSSLRKLLPTIIDETMDRKSEPISTTPKLTQVADHVMPRLTHASKLNFVSDVWYRGLPHVLWTTLHSRTSSTKSPHPITLHSVFTTTAWTFSLHACRPYHTAEIHRIVLENDPAFLLAHESTILTRCIVRDPTSPILQCLRLISCLYDISLPLPYALTTTGISFNDGRDILETQQHPRSLDLSITRSIFLFLQPLAKNAC